MPKFYFDQSGGGVPPKEDSVGLDFRDLARASTHAMTLLPVMGVEMPMSAGEFRTWTSSVRDDRGVTVARFIMAIINDNLGQGVEKVLRPIS